MEDVCHRVFIPHPLLLPYIQTILAVETKCGFKYDLRTILPSGYMKFVIMCKNTWTTTMDKVTKKVPENSCIIVGQSTKPRIFELDPNSCDIAFVFRPSAAYKLFNFPLCQIVNQFYDTEDVLGPAGHELQQKISETLTLQGKISLVEGFFLDILSSPRPSNLSVEYAVNQIVARKGLIRVGELAHNVGYSERHLARQFGEYVGISPKEFAGVIRFQAFYRQYCSAEGFDLELLTNFYYDQSHLAKEFRRFTGYNFSQTVRKENNFGNIFLHQF